MNEQEYNIILWKIDYDDNSQGNKLWFLLHLSCSRSQIAFWHKFFLIICDCFWRFHFSKTCDELTICVWLMCSCPQNIFYPQKTENKLICKEKSRILIIGRIVTVGKNAIFSKIGPKIETFEQIWQNFVVLSQFPVILQFCAEKCTKIMSSFQVWTSSF